MDVGATIRDARRAAGLTQAELAERCATSQATLSDYERGLRDPSSATLARVLAACGMRLAVAPAARPVRARSAAALERAGRTLVEVVELAAALPTRHRETLDFPRLPAPPATGA